MPDNDQLSNDPNDQGLRVLPTNPYKKNCPIISDEQNQLLNQLAEQIADIQNELQLLQDNYKHELNLVNNKLAKTYLTLGFLYNTFKLDINEKTSPSITCKLNLLS